MRIVCEQTIPMKYHALYVIFEKAAKFEIVVCCKLQVGLYGLKCHQKFAADDFFKPNKAWYLKWTICNQMSSFIPNQERNHNFKSAAVMIGAYLVGLLFKW